MQYHGGKSRIVSHLSPILRAYANERQRYVEPFIGGGSMFSAVADAYEVAEAGDCVPDLIMLWEAVRQGWVPPSTLSREEWRTLRASREPSALRAFAGYGVSFGGKWFAGYAFNKSGREYAEAASRGIVKKAQRIPPSARIVLRDYREWEADERTVFYCDPPYAGTTEYGAAKNFNSREFWKQCDQWRDAGALVFVSEEKAPAHWYPVWRMEVRRKLDVKTNAGNLAVETLFSRT